MDQKALSAKLDQIAGLVVEMYAMLDDAPVAIEAGNLDLPIPVDAPTGPFISINPWANTPEMVRVINDDHLEAGPRIVDNFMSSRYWHKIWDIADKAGVKFVILRGAHPDGCVDIKYPQANGILDKAAMGWIIDAFLSVCVPVDSINNETEIRMGSDVWPLVNNRHIQIDDTMHHRFDDKEYPHFHLRVGLP